MVKIAILSILIYILSLDRSDTILSEELKKGKDLN